MGFNSPLARIPLTITPFSPEFVFIQSEIFFETSDGCQVLRIQGSRYTENQGLIRYTFGGFVYFLWGGHQIHKQSTKMAGFAKKKAGLRCKFVCVS